MTMDYEASYRDVIIEKYSHAFVSNLGGSALDGHALGSLTIFCYYGIFASKN